MGPHFHLTLQCGAIHSFLGQQVWGGENTLHVRWSHWPRGPTLGSKASGPNFESHSVPVKCTYKLSEHRKTFMNIIRPDVATDY